MNSPNFILEGLLAIPGSVRVRMPPPFGTPRDIVQAIEASHARVLQGEMMRALEASRQMLREQWRLRITVAAVGLACTVAAALVGAYTGQHRQSPPHFDQAPFAAIAQAPAPAVPPEALPIESALVMMANENAENEAAPAEAKTAPAAGQPAVPVVDPAASTLVEPTPVRSPAKVAKPRTLARAGGRAAAPAARARPAAPVYEELEVVETYRAMADSVPISSAYVAPSTPVRIELQHHTRLTD